MSELLTAGRASVGIVLTKTVVAVDPPSITTLALGTVAVTVPGVVVGDLVIATPPATLEAGLVPISAIVTAPNTVTLTLLNAKGTTVDGASLNWTFALVG